MRKAVFLWLVWFFLLMALAYSPYVAPYGDTSFVYGLPSTLFYWVVLAFAVLVSIILFVTHQWRYSR